MQSIGPDPTKVYAQIITEPLSIKESLKILYKQLVKSSAEKSEWINIGKVKLTPGAYIWKYPILLEQKQF